MALHVDPKVFIRCWAACMVYVVSGMRHPIRKRHADFCIGQITSLGSMSYSTTCGIFSVL